MSARTFGPVAIDAAEAMGGLGARLAALLGAGDVLVLTGRLGAGKTTLVRGLGEALGVRGTVSSPTFVIARTHPPLADGPALIHVDAYRLDSALELDDLDLDLDTSVTVIEWGSEVVGAIADSWLELVIERPRAAALEDAAEAVHPAGQVGASGSARDDRGRGPADGVDADLALDEPRTVTLRAVGPRWAEVRDEVLDALLAP